MHYLTVFFSQRINLDEKSFSHTFCWIYHFKVVLSDPGPAEAREQPAAGGELGPPPGDGQDC